MTPFEFHAEVVLPQPAERSLSFADQAGNQQHYLVLARGEESPDQPEPDLRNVYIERDDQCWGGWGGIESVRLERDALTIWLGARMANQLGYEVLRVTFHANEDLFGDVKELVRVILRGYEDRAHLPP